MPKKAQADGLQREDHAGDCRTHEVSEYASGNGAKTITGDKFAVLKI